MAYGLAIFLVRACVASFSWFFVFSSLSSLGWQPLDCFFVLSYIAHSILQSITVRTTHLKNDWKEVLFRKHFGFFLFLSSLVPLSLFRVLFFPTSLCFPLLLLSFLGCVENGAGHSLILFLFLFLHPPTPKYLDLSLKQVFLQNKIQTQRLKS